MKQIWTVGLILVSSLSFGQSLVVKDIRQYFKGYNQHQGRYVYKVGKTACWIDTLGSFGTLTNFSIMPHKDSSASYEIYKSRFLFVSFYPKEIAISSIGIEYRLKWRLQIYDLLDSSKKWEFNLKGWFTSYDINCFDSDNGRISLNLKQEDLDRIPNRSLPLSD